MLTSIMMVRVRLGLGYCLVYVIFNLATERMGQISGDMGTGQLVPKSTRTLVNSYPFLVNSYLSQLVPKSTRTLVYL